MNSNFVFPRCKTVLDNESEVSILRFISQEHAPVVYAAYAVFFVGPNMQLGMEVTPKIEAASVITAEVRKHCREFFAREYDSRQDIFVNEIIVTKESLHDKEKQVVKNFWSAYDDQEQPQETEQPKTVAMNEPVKSFFPTCLEMVRMNAVPKAFHLQYKDRTTGVGFVRFYVNAVGNIDFELTDYPGDATAVTDTLRGRILDMVKILYREGGTGYAITEQVISEKVILCGGKPFDIKLVWPSIDEVDKVILHLFGIPVPEKTVTEPSDPPNGLFDIDDKFHRSLSNRGLLYIQVEELNLSSETSAPKIAEEGYLTLLQKNGHEYIQLVSDPRLVSKATISRKSELLEQIVEKYMGRCRVFKHPDNSSRETVNLSYSTRMEQVFPALDGMDHRVMVQAGVPAPRLVDKFEPVSTEPDTTPDLQLLMDSNPNYRPGGWGGKVILYAVHTSKDGFVKNCGFVQFKTTISDFQDNTVLVQNKQHATRFDYATAVRFLRKTRVFNQLLAPEFYEYLPMFVKE